LRFDHPITGEPMHFSRPLPKKMRRIFGDLTK